MNRLICMGKIALFLALLAGCNLETKGRFVEIVALEPSNPREFSFQVVPVDPKNNPIERVGEDLVLLSNSKIQLSVLAETAKSSLSFASLEERLSKYFGGDLLELSLTESEGVYRATTLEAMLSLSAYHHLLSIIKFAQKLGLENNLSLENPLKLALYADIFMGEDSIFPSGDNALYIGSADMMVLLPISDNEGLPVAMNQGVLAHEYHHRLFFKRIWHSQDAKKSWRRYQRRFLNRRSKLFNRSEKLLTATDEALADLFAVAFTSLPDYLSLSLTTPNGKKIKDQRDLNGELANRMTYELLAFPGGDKEIIARCGNSKNFSSANYNFYCLGSVIAKTLYEASNKDINMLRNFTIKAVHEALDVVANKIANGHYYNVYMLFEALAKIAKQNNPIFYQKLCNQIQTRFSIFIKRGWVPSCKK